MKARVIIFFLHLFAKLPLSVLHRIGDLGGALLYRKGGRAVSTTRINLQLCYPHLTETERETRVRASLQELVKTSLEMGPAWLWSPQRLLSAIKQVEGHELVAQAQEQGRGVIIVAPHLGNWEILGAYLGEHFQTMCMYQPPKEPLLDKMIYDSRLRCKIEVAPTDRKGIMALLKKLKSGGCIGILPDQEPDLSGGEFAPFFGHPALTMTLLSNLVKKTDALPVASYLKRLPKGQGFALVFAEADAGIVSSDIQESTAALNRTVQACVEAAPEQYQWEYKRFKRQPEGLPKIYPKGI